MTKRLYRLTDANNKSQYLAVAKTPEDARTALGWFNEQIDIEAAYVEEVAAQRTFSDSTILGADRVVYFPRNDLKVAQIGGSSPLHGVSDPIRLACSMRLGRKPLVDEDRHYLAIKYGKGDVWLWKGDAFAFVDQQGLLWCVPGDKLVD